MRRTRCCPRGAGRSGRGARAARTARRRVGEERVDLELDGASTLRARCRASRARRAARAAPRRSAKSGRGRRARSARRSRSARSSAPSGSITIWRHVGAAEPGPDRLRRDHVADADHEVGRKRVGQVAEQRVVGGDHLLAVVVAAAQLRGRLGEDRVAACPRERGGGSGEPRIAAAAGEDHAARGSGDASRRTARTVSAGGSRPRSETSVSGRVPRPSRASACVAVTPPRSGSGASGSRQRDVQVHRARRACPSPRRPRAPRRAVVEQARVVGRRDAQLAEPAHRAAVELELVDRLPRAAAAQLRRAVGGQHDQRHPCLVGLGDGGVDVRAGRARGRERRPRARRSAWAIPSAKKPAQRSSTWLQTRIPGSFQSASASGAEREPGDTHACRTPARASSSASAEASAVLRFVGSTGRRR